MMVPLSIPLMGPEDWQYAMWKTVGSQDTQ